MFPALHIMLAYYFLLYPILNTQQNQWRRTCASCINTSPRLPTFCNQSALHSQRAIADFSFLSNHVKCERDCFNNNLFNNPTHSSCRNHAFAVPSHHLVFHIGRFVHHGSDQPASSSTNSQKLHDIMKSSNSFAIGVVLLLLLGHEANCSSILIKASLLHFQIIAITNLKKTNEKLAVKHISLHCSAHTKP